MLPDVLTAEAVAEALDCELLTVQQRAIAGTLPGVKFGRSWVFPRDALVEALNRQAREQAAARQAPKPAPKPEAAAKPGRRRTTLPNLS